MPRRAVVPIGDVNRRLPEAGRLRFGVKSGRAMKAIPTWRATSHDEEAISQIAAECGGTPKPWTDAPTPGQFEVITEAAELRIVLPPNPLGGTPIYEQWSGGGCQRRCDGAQCEIVAAGADGAEYQEVPCICLAKGEMECEPRLRLSVILPFIRFGGVWRMETKSWNAVAEIPAMVDLILGLQDRGLTRGILALKHRKTVTAGQTHRFIVPVLGVDETIEALAAGTAQVGSLGSGNGHVPTAGELGAGSSEGGEDSPRGDLVGSEGVAGATPAPATSPPSDPDDEPVDAEIVDEPTSRSEPFDPMTEQQSKALHALLRAKKAAIGPDRHKVLSEMLGRTITSASEVSFNEAGSLIERLQEMPNLQPAGAS